MQLMLRLFGIIEINALEIAKKSPGFAPGFLDYFAGINIDNPSKRNIDTLIKNIAEDNMVYSKQFGLEVEDR